MPTYESSNLREERASVYEQMQAVLDSAKSEERDLTDEERTQLDELEVRFDKIDSDLKRAEKLEAIAPSIDKRDARPDVEARGRVEVTNEPVTYAKEDRTKSYFMDLVEAREGSFEAQQRLSAHQQEVRALSTTAGAGGEFAPPLWLQEEWVSLARAARPFANAVRRLPLPQHVGSINLPKVSGGSATAAQSDNGSVQSTDMTSSSVTIPIITVAGNQDVSRQILDRSNPGIDQVIFDDLVRDYNTKVDVQALTGSGSAPNAKGVLNVSGINAVTYTDASPDFGGAGKLAAKIGDAIQQIHTNRFLPPTAIVMHPRRWGWIVSRSDSQSRPLVTPYAGVNNIGQLEAVASENVVGSILGLPVIVDASIPTNLGASTNEDRVIVCRLEDLYLFENDTPQMKVFEEVLSGSLGVRFQVYNYLAFSGERYPKAVSVISGTGLVTPTF